MSFRQDAARLQKLTNNAFCQTGILAALADSGQPDPDKMQKALEQTAAQFENAALEVRKLCEKYSPGTGGYSAIKYSFIPSPCPLRTMLSRGGNERNFRGTG